MKLNNTISKLWYKNYMVWIFVIGLPLGMVLLCAWMVNYAFKNEDSVVRDDWYMDGKTLYADVSKDKLSHDLGLSAHMEIANDGKVQVQLYIPQQDKMLAPNNLRVEISHATQIQKDRDFDVKKIGDSNNTSNYEGNVKLDPTKGKYYIVVHDPKNTWRLRDVIQLPSSNTLKFVPLKSFDKDNSINS